MKTLLAMTILLSACASASPARTWGLPPAATAEVNQTCEATLGIVPGNAWFNACADSVSRTLQSRMAATTLDRAHEACLHDGLELHTPAFDRCVVERMDAPASAGSEDSAAQTHSEAGTPPPIGNVKRAEPAFRSLTRAERLHRQRLACAGLGFDPIAPEFSACVVSLSQAFFTLDNPR